MSSRVTRCSGRVSLGSAGKQKKRKSRAEEKPVTGFGLLSSSNYRTVGFSVLLVLATVSVYSSVGHNSFVNYDDDKYIVGLPQMHQPFGWGLFHWAFTGFALGNWHPLTWLSHALDYQLFQSTPAAVHFENVLIHAASSVLLFLALQKATAKFWESLVVAALFALHPLNVESVAWGAERKNVLSMFFFVLSLLEYGRYATRRTIGRYLAVLAAFTLGLLAKPQIVTLPFVLLLWDIWPLGRWPQAGQPGAPEKSTLLRLILEKTPLFLLAAASSVITLRAQAEAGTVGSLVEYPISVRLENAVIEYVRYLASTLWPSNLAVLYPYPLENVPAWQTISALAVLLAISAFVIVARKQRYLAVGWFWFLGTMVPMIGLVQVGSAARADRYMYLPAIGLFLLAVWGVSNVAQERRISDVWLGVSSVIVLILLGALTIRQVSYWRDSETLWKHTLEATRNNAIAEGNLGSALISLGRADEAAEHFRRALAIDPENSLAQVFVGIDEGKHGNPLAAVEHFKMALQRPIQMDLAELAYSNLGTAYRNLHDYAQARQCFEVALRINPTDSAAAIGMGLVAQHEKNLPEAIRWYSQATLARPNAVASLLLANAMGKNGQLAESKEAYQRAANIGGDLGASERVVEQMLTNLD